MPVAEADFDYSAYEGKISALEPLVGKSGWMSAELLTIEALGQSEDCLLLAGRCDDGAPLSDEAANRLLTIGATRGADVTVPTQVEGWLLEQLGLAREKIRKGVSERNARFLKWRR